ncbi:two-component regulator propeller domain-containing protein [Bacteroides sp. 51]|uniref:hybrid sensor histidine kinase/response regulator transcription factor n=1 Tax=Bacteroides sp. 51 TaxID=2302938 RepID=UPI0013D81EE0|nr:two-component regulator propeller domain-containing protein [Bacteroides sp. 51]NDV83046.1 hybrid sensor histidine kinase/response regulator [Bacteroides sp. 51]
MRYILTLVFLFVLVHFSFSQSEKQMVSDSFTYQYLTTKEGLSNQRVFNIIEGQNGMIWISTKSGVDRYDGRNVKNYNLFGEDIIEDGSGRIIRLIRDSHNQLWAYTNAARIFRYDPVCDRFNLEIDVTALVEEGISLNDLYIDEKDNFWIGLKNGLFCLRKGIGIINLLNDKCVNTLTYSPTTRKMYVATMEGLYELSLSDQKLTVLLSGGNIQSVFYDTTTALLWIGSFNDGISIMDTRTNRFRLYPQLKQLPSLPYRAITPYDSETLLLGIDGAGVYAIRRDVSSVWSFANANQEEDGKLNGNGIYAIYKDTAANLWIGSYTGGVTVANPKTYSFEIIQHEYKNPQSLINNHVNAILEDHDGDLWYATDQGISVYIGQSHTWKHFLKENVFLTLCSDNQGNVWAGGYSTGVYCINKNTGIRKHIAAEQAGTLTTNYIYSIVRDEDGELWFGGMYGNLIKYTPPGKDRKESFTYYNIDLVNSINIVNRDTIAIATVNGFYLLNKHTRIFKHYFSEPRLAGTKSNSFIYSMYFATPNQVWFSTDGGGINLFDLTTEQATTYSTANGLPSNYVYAILPDREGRLWLSTDKGLAYIDPSHAYEITNIGFLEGLANEFNFMSYTQLKDGSFVFGSTKGAVHFHPDHFSKQIYKAPLHFTSFEVPQKSHTDGTNKQLHFNRTLQEGKEINLKYNENSFLISFISVSYQYQQDIRYTYMMEGFDQHWSTPNEDLSVRYTNIPPGNYVFKVKSMSENGKNTLDEKTLHIHIAQPYWNTLAAWILYIALFLGVTYFVWRFFANKMEKKHFSDKIQFFINTAHDIRTPVTLIMAPLGDLDKESSLSDNGRRYLQIAQNNTEKLYNLITQLLDFQKTDTTSTGLKVSEYNVQAYLREKAINFQSLCHNKQIRLQLELPEEPLYLWLDKDKADKIFDNLLSNAIKYTTPGGEVIMTVRHNDKKVFVEIKDSGIGIPRKAQQYIFSNFYRAENAVNSKETGSGIGLLLTRRLMKLHKGKISFTSVEKEGSTFLATFRKGHKHLSRYIQVDKGQPQNTLNSTVKDAHVPHHPITETGNSIENDPSKTRIMVVEDNDELRFYLKKTFENKYQVIDMPDGESTLAYLADKSVELIISDIMMPGIQGDELCRRVKTDFTTSHIPVILLTAKTEKGAILQGLESGADDYLTKPFDTEILKTKVWGVLNNRKIMREYFLNHTLEASASNQEEEKCLDQMSDMDKAFLDRCIALVYDNISSPDFSINTLCREVALSRTIFYEKLKSLTGQAPNEFIKLIRMKEAANLLQQNVPVQDVALRIGFTDAKYFSTAFKKHYGVSPSKFVP